MAGPDHSALKRLIEYATEEAAGSELYLTACLLRMAASSLASQDGLLAPSASAEERALFERVIGRHRAANKIIPREKLQ